MPVLAWSRRSRGRERNETKDVPRIGGGHLEPRQGCPGVKHRKEEVTEGSEEDGESLQLLEVRPPVTWEGDG